MTNKQGLISAEHGVLGEARARAFLLNRFWVLERSVDVFGADFLIQRRLTERTQGDLQRLGVIQVKFVQGDSTQLRIPASYAATGQALDEPRAEFFLLVCTGNETDERMFLMTASEILEKFDRVTAKSGKTQFTKGSSHILNSSDHEILDRGTALGRIERGLQRANFAENRRYLNLMGFVGRDEVPIDEHFVAPIQSWYGPIEENFRRLRSKASEALSDVQSISDGLVEMAEATDPASYMRAYNRYVAEHVDSRGQAGFGVRDLLDEDLENAAQETSAYWSRLQDKGVLTGFCATLTKVEREVARIVHEATAQHYRLTVDFNINDMRPVAVIAQTTEAPPTPLPRLVAAATGWLNRAMVTVVQTPPNSIVLIVGPLQHGSLPGLPSAQEFLPSIACEAVQVLLHEWLFSDDSCPHIHPPGRLHSVLNANG